jgi:N-acetyl-gamma-glutamyl-phosphate reductase
MATKVKVGIVGGAGYTGGETIRLLLNHPYAELVFVHSRSNAGNPIHTVHSDLLGDTPLRFSDTINQSVDVLFYAWSCRKQEISSDNRLTLKLR